MNKRLRHLFWPFAAASLLSLAVYALQAWRLWFRQPGGLPEENTFMHVMPFLISCPLAALVVLLATRKLNWQRLLLKEKARLYVAAIVLAAFPYLFIPRYVDTKTGVLTSVNNVEDMFHHDESKFYRIGQYRLSADDALSVYGVYAPRKSYHTKRDIYMRYAVPFQNPGNDPEPTNVWLVFEYRKTVKHYAYMDGREISREKALFEEESRQKLAEAVKQPYDYFSMVVAPKEKDHYHFITRYPNRFIKGYMFLLQGNSGSFTGRWQQGFLIPLLTFTGSLLAWLGFSLIFKPENRH